MELLISIQDFIQDFVIDHEGKSKKILSKNITQLFNTFSGVWCIQKSKKNISKKGVDNVVLKI